MTPIAIKSNGRNGRNGRSPDFYPEVPTLANPDAEYRILASIAVEPALLDELDGLDPDHFAILENRKLWQTVLDDTGKGRPPRLPLGELCNRTGNITPLPEYIRDDARIVRELAYCRDILWRGLPALARATQSGDPARVDAVIEKLAGGSRPVESSLRSATDIGLDFVVRVNELEASPGAGSVMTGISAVDNALGGLERGTTTGIAGRPSMGKSAMMLQWAANMARSGPVAFFSLEMSASLCFARMACGPAGVPWVKVRRGTASPEEYALVRAHSRRIMESLPHLYISDRVMTSAEIMAEARELKRQGGLNAFFVDHVKLAADVGDSEVLRLGKITQTFHAGAKSLDAAGVLAVQLNRGVEGRRNKCPDLADIRGSGEIEENVDILLALYRPGYYDPGEGNLAELWTRKFRDGERNLQIRLEFIKERQWFQSLDLSHRKS